MVRLVYLVQKQRSRARPIPKKSGNLCRRQKSSEKPCPLFVPLVEEGFAKHKITEEVIDIYLSDMRKSEIDTLILGCTHYPLLRSRIMAYFGESVHIVNPAYETAMDLKQILEEQKIANTSGEPAAYDFYVSDAAEKFKNLPIRSCRTM